MHLNVKTYETEAKLRLSEEKCLFIFIQLLIHLFIINWYKVLDNSF